MNMARKKTRKELERENEHLHSYQELVFALFRNKDCAKRIGAVYGPHKIESGEYVFWLYAVDRAAGGIILGEDNAVLGYACDVAQRWEAIGHADPYLLDCARQVRRLQTASAQESRT
jgi:hypothetical protein